MKELQIIYHLRFYYLIEVLKHLPKKLGQVKKQRSLVRFDVMQSFHYNFKDKFIE